MARPPGAPPGPAPRPTLVGAVLGESPVSRRGLDRELWRRVVGTHIAERTAPDRVQGGVLHVRAATGPWAQELTLLAPLILQRLAAEGLAVTHLRFRVGEVPPLPPVYRSVTRPPPPGPLPPELEVALRAIDDPELRAAIEDAAAHTLALTSGPRPPAPGSRSGSARSGRSG